MVSTFFNFRIPAHNHFRIIHQPIPVSLSNFPSSDKYWHNVITIDFEVSKSTMVQLNIYNLNGQKVDVLKNAFTLPGYYSAIWNGTNHPSGIYFVILHSSNSVVRQKMMLIK